MSRNISDLHPTLQKKIEELKVLCKKNGINIGISECLRTVAEQDALYAKGRTAPGSIVTNCKGSSYSSMHQWGVAFDFYLIMDVDGDGKTSDDAYNDSTNLFKKVGKLGESIGLEWGGSWTSIIDKPHFQLPDWGSTATKLKKAYKTPEAFRKTWTNSTNTKKTSSTKLTKTTTVESAKSKSAKVVGSYKTESALNLRLGAGTNKGVVDTIPKGKTVICYGYYTTVNSIKWYLVSYGKKTGYVSSKYLKAI